MSLKTLASQTAVYGLSTMVGRFLNFLLVPLYTYSLHTVADYGVVSVMFTYASLFAVIFSFGMETSYFYFARKENDAHLAFANGTWFTLIWSLLLMVLAWIFQTSIMDVVGYPQKPQYAVWFAAILGADAVCAMGFAKLRLENRPYSFAAIRLTNIFINIGLNLFFVLLCPWLISKGNSFAWYHSTQLVDYIFLSNLIASLATLAFFIPSWKKLPKGCDLPFLRKMIQYGWPIIFIGLAGMINETLDRALLKWILPSQIADHEIGIYSAFYKLSLVLTLFIQSFRFAAEPFFFKASENQNAPHTYAHVMKWFVYFTGWIVLLTTACLPWLAPLFIRNVSYFADHRGLMVVPILLFANWFMGIFYNLNIWYKVSNNTRKGAYISLVGAAITLLFNMLFIKQYGFVACAFITLAAYCSMAVTSYLMGKKYYPIPYQMSKIFLSMFLVAGSVAASYLIGENFLYFASLIYPITIAIIERYARSRNSYH